MSLPTDPAPWTFYRLGPTKEKVLFKRQYNTYDGVVVPAHLASYYAAFCAEFIGSLRKPYFIDPMTYVFARDVDLLKRYTKDKDTGKTLRDRYNQKIKGNTKRSYVKLIEEYSGVIQQASNETRSLRISDLAASDKADALVEKVVSFQKDKLAAIPAKYAKYKKYTTDDKFAATNNPPMMILPPYFFADRFDDSSWHTVNIDLAARTRKRINDLPVFGVIFCSLSSLETFQSQIIRDYSNLGLDGFVVWIDDFKGSQNVDQLRIARNFVVELSKLGKPILSMYGDFFSLILSYYGLTGYCCGICYGQHKSIVQDSDMEGAIPVLYYVNPIKRKMTLETLKRIPFEKYPELICDCEICTSRVDMQVLDDFAAKEHFMLSRIDETNAIRGGQSASDLSKTLKASYERFKDEPVVQPVVQLANWSKILDDSAETR